MSFAASVIIPTYNRADFIVETLTSILAQSKPAAEIIVVDDGSTDHTEALLRAQFPRVIYHRTENRGAPHARNIGVGLSRGTHIAFCDSDDIWLPDHLANICTVFESDPAIGLVFSNFREMADAGSARVIAAHSKLDQLPPSFWPQPLVSISAIALRCDAPLATAILRFQPVFPSALALTRDAYIRAGGFKPELGMLPAEDLEFTLRAVRQAPIGVVTAPGVLIRKHDGNHSRRVGEMLIGEIIVLGIALQSHNPPLELATALRAEMARRGAAAMDALYMSGRTAPLPAMAAALGWSNLPRKLQLKAALSLLPTPLAQRLALLLARTHAPSPPLSADLRTGLNTALANLRA